MGRVNLLTVLMLTVSNAIMLYAWYGHLRSLASVPAWVAIVVSWGIAFAEYCLVVPANRIGARTMSVAELKIIQEAVSLLVFIPFSIVVMKSPVGWNYAAAALCVLGAVYFMFRG